MNRRNFLKVLGLGAAGAALPKIQAEAPRPDPDPSNFDGDMKAGLIPLEEFKGMAGAQWPFGLVANCCVPDVTILKRIDPPTP